MRDLIHFVIKRRLLATAVLRGIGLALLVTGLVLSCYGLGRAVIWSGIGNLLGDYSNANLLAQGATLTVFGLALGLVSRRAARWLVPMPRHECPECGYRLQKLAQPRCPECGLDLPKAMVEADRNG